MAQSHCMMFIACVLSVGAVAKWEASYTLDIAKFQSELGDSQPLCRSFVYRDMTSSTMDLAAREFREGAKHGTLILAEEQTQGRGRAGSIWRSPGEANLYMSIVLRPIVSGSGAGDHVVHVNFATALAVARAIKVVEPSIEPELRWPRTVEVDGMKVSGSLIKRVDLDDAASGYIVGIGVNVNANLCQNSSFSQEVTSLRCIAKRQIDRERLLAKICTNLGSMLAGQSIRELQAEFLSLASSTAASGVEVSILDKVSKQHITDAVVMDLADNMTLVVRTETGKLQYIDENGTLTPYAKGRRYRHEL